METLSVTFSGKIDLMEVCHVLPNLFTFCLENDRGSSFLRRSQICLTVSKHKQ